MTNTLITGPTVARDAAGRSKHILFVGQDVTAVRKTMAKCMELASLYKLVIEESSAPIFGVSEEGLVTDWNAATVKMTKVDFHPFSL
jgi:hypothetical protein